MWSLQQGIWRHRYTFTLWLFACLDSYYDIINISEALDDWFRLHEFERSIKWRQNWKHEMLFSFFCYVWSSLECFLSWNALFFQLWPLFGGKLTKPDGNQLFYIPQVCVDTLYLCFQLLSFLLSSFHSVTSIMFIFLKFFEPCKF